MIEISNNVTYCRRREESGEYASLQVFSPQSTPSMVSTEPPKQKLHISIHSVSDLNLHFKYSSSHKRKNGTEAKPNKKFITSKVLQQRSLYQFLVGGYRYQYPLDIKTGRSFIAQFFTFRLSLSFWWSWHEVRGETKSTFYSTFFPLYFVGEKNTFLLPSAAIRLCLIQCITNLQEVVSNLKLISKKKCCSIDSCSERRQFLIPFCAS